MACCRAYLLIAAVSASEPHPGPSTLRVFSTAQRQTAAPPTEDVYALVHGPAISALKPHLRGCSPLVIRTLSQGCSTRLRDSGHAGLKLGSAMQSENRIICGDAKDRLGRMILGGGCSVTG